ncbi:MAG: PQQ-binding-like beta-propeller repeat protein [Acidimicrobiia bacterium]|nr:PQQ-binding-like beta-propeller repeat protein [Acidimicrobiia bacterium]
MADPAAARARLVLGGLLALVVAAGLYGFVSDSGDDDGSASESGPDPGPTATPVPYDGWVDPASVGGPVGQTVPGLLTFRGNPTRTFYGQGLPNAPVTRWRFPVEPEEPLCSLSTVGPETTTTTEWCGTGWTGQPAIFEREGRTWVVFGSFGSAVHFLDGATGTRLLPDFAVGDIIKGSVTIDPDGFPIVYFGSRDNFLRAVSFDGPVAEELWSLDAESISPRLHDNDWDGTPLVIDDYLFEGGENSQLHIVKLNRGYDDVTGRVTLAPELVFNTPGWDDELLEALDDDNVSIESSVAISGNTLFVANSGGLIQGWDISGIEAGLDPTRTFRFWVGDDTDATLVVDDEGALYVGVEFERPTDVGTELGQIIKLDPSMPDDPVVWSLPAQVRLPDGVWATPALTTEMLYVPTNEGFLKGIDRTTGDLVWEKKLQGPLWSSPVVVDDVLVQPDCLGVIHAYDVSDPTVDPPEIWTVSTDWCTESTVAVWNGLMVVGDRKGHVWAYADGP